MLEPLRLTGGVWGHLIGDAMGVPYEFKSAYQIKSVEWGAHGSHGVPAGTWSDDGALMLGLLDALLPDPHSEPPRNGGFDLATQARNYLRWWRKGAFTPDGKGFDIGNTTVAALTRLEGGTPPDRSGVGEDGLGNGSLMRSVAIALVGRDLDARELVDWAERSSAVTHAATLARVTCALYALVCQRLLKAQNPAAALAGAKVDLRAAYAGLGDGGKLEALERVLGWKERRGSGHVVDCFWSAWESFSGSGDYAGTIERAIRYGNDTDTTACVAGGMAGIHWGIDGIPDAWLSRMRGKRVARPIADRLVETAGWKTSYGDPIRVNWIDQSAVPPGSGWTGKLGMTFLPGKQDYGQRHDWWRDLPEDVAGIAAAGARTLAVLVEDHELATTRVHGLHDALAAEHMELIRFPITDLSVPADPSAFAAFVGGVVRRLRAGRNVAVACRGGVGRTGLVAACLLADAGLSGEEAITLTRATRPGTIETAAQLDFIRAYAAGRVSPGSTAG